MPTTGRRDLDRSVTSALAQRDVDVEVVVVMNGPGETPTPSADPRVRVIRSDPGLRGNGARAAGIRESAHALVALLDDDDFWEPDKLARQHELAERLVPGAPADADDWIVSCAIVEHLEGDRRRLVPTEDPGEIGDIAEYLARRPRLRSIGQQFQSSTLLFPRRLGLAHPFDPTVPVHQDWGWVIGCQRSGARIGCLYEPLSHRVLGSADAMTRAITWRESLRWSRRFLDPASRRARGDFALTIAADRAAAGRDLRGWLRCGWEGVRRGLPGPFAWIFYGSLLVRMAGRR